MQRFATRLATVVLAVASQAALAAGTGRVSARRLPNEDWRDAIARQAADALGEQAAAARFETEASDVYDEAVAFDELKTTVAPTWTSLAALTAAFGTARDERHWDDPERSDFRRRLSWLYPDDGCFARASLVRDVFEEHGLPGTAKLFILGNLHVATSNSPDGGVDWGWHVVPVVRIGAELYVIDPAIDPKAPMTARAWALKQVSSLSHASFAICGTHAYTPWSRCTGAPATEDQDARRDLDTYLDLEWDRQTELGRDPKKVLGDTPPWRS
jgi:hypothetical protein